VFKLESFDRWLQELATSGKPPTAPDSRRL
jgi:hypothetical protein